MYYTVTQGLDPANMTHAYYAVFPTAYPSFVTSATGGPTFSIANFNVLPVVNASQEVNGMVVLRIDVVTALLNVPMRVSFAGGTNIIGCIAQPKSATGTLVYWDAATFLVAGGDLIVDFDTGASVDPADGEFVDIILFGQFAGIQA